MPPKNLDGFDLGRGERFSDICEKLFPSVANVEIGRILSGLGHGDTEGDAYSEGTIRRWKAGGPIGATALLNLHRLGVSLEYLLEGKDEAHENAPPAPASGERMVDVEIADTAAVLAGIQAELSGMTKLALHGEITGAQFMDVVNSVLIGFQSAATRQNLGGDVVNE